MRLSDMKKKGIALTVLAGFALGVSGCAPAPAPAPAKTATPAAAPGAPEDKADEAPAKGEQAGSDTGAAGAEVPEPAGEK